MDDLFIEKLVSREATVLTYLMKGGLWAVAALATLFLLFSPLSMVAPLVGLGLFWGAWFLSGRLSQEFEYSLTNGELDIDVIMSQRSRKRFLSLSAGQMELMAPADASHQREFDTKVDKVFDASSSPRANHRWFILFRQGQTRCKLVFEPDQRFIDGMRRYNPRAVQQ